MLEPTPHAPPSPPPQPTAQHERLHLLDAVRGLALLGILWVNFFNTADLFPSSARTDLERNVVFVQQFLAYGKFISLFSLLFGIGFALQLGRLAGRSSEEGARSVYQRRLWVLLALGVLHYVLIWDGDVLHVYAALGFLLLAAWKVRGRALLLRSLAFLGIGAGVNLGYGLLENTLRLPYPPVGDDRTLLEFVTTRATDLDYIFWNTFFYGPFVLGIFFFGKWLVDTGRILRPLEHLRFWGLTLAWALPLGVGLNAWHVWSLTRGDDLGYSLHSVIGFPLALAYLSGMVFWYARGGRARWLETAGRMALSNYIGQSLAFTFVLYPYGLNWDRGVTPVTGTLYVFGFFALQVLLSHLWLSKFRMGPLEGLWRVLTYGRTQPRVHEREVSRDEQNR